MQKPVKTVKPQQNERGSGFLEAALILPLMLLMCCGVMDFARVVYAGVEVANAARAGVQFGALTPGNSGNTAGMVSAAQADAADLGSSNVTATASNFCACTGVTGTVSCSTTCVGATPNGYVSVTANYTFNTVVTYPGVPSQVVLSRTAKMRVQ
jgi:Flp pilus assembly protein TadG